MLPFIGAFGDRQAVAAPRPFLKGEGLTIYYDPGNEESAQRFMKAYPAMKEDVEAALGWRLRARPTLNLVGDANEFQRMAGGSLVAGFAVPSKSLMVINLDTFMPQIFIMSGTFKHELCHLLLHENIRSRNLPKWLDEGVCQWVSGDIGEALFLRQLGLSVEALDLSRNPPTLQTVTESFHSGGRSMALSYRASLNFVRFVTEQHGREGLIAILENLKKGMSIKPAVKAATGQTLSALEAAWHEDLRRRNFWIMWAGRNVDQVLFALAGFLTFIAFIKILIRKRRRYRYEDEEDGDL